MVDHSFDQIHCLSAYSKALDCKTVVATSELKAKKSEIVLVKSLCSYETQYVVELLQELFMKDRKEITQILFSINLEPLPSCFPFCCWGQEIKRVKKKEK